MANKAVKYWFSYWNDLIKDLISSKDYNTTIDSPRFLIDDMISEIEYNDFANEDNRNSFRRRLESWKDKEHIFRDKFKSKFNLLFASFDKSKSLYFLSVIKDMKKSFDTGEYYESLIKELATILTDEAELCFSRKKKINQYSSLLIAEFIAKNFDLKDIGDFASKIEDLAIQEGGGVVFAPDMFQHLNKQDFSSEEEYHAEIDKLLDERSIEDIVRNLDIYYYKEPIDCYAIIELKGVKGVIDITIGDINIYSPKTKTYISNHFGNNIEFVEESREKLLAAVPVKHISLFSSIKEAITKSTQIIDFFTLYYNTKEKIELCTKHIPIVNKDKVLICAKGGLSVSDKHKELDHKEFRDYMSAIEIDHIKNSLGENIDMFIPINTSKVSSTELQLSNAIHWHNKAVIAKNNEDKLLFSWVAIESVFRVSQDVFKNIICDTKKDKKIYAIQKIGSSLITRRHFWDYCHRVYISLVSDVQLLEERMSIPRELISKASLNLQNGDMLEFCNFFENIIDIADSIKSKRDFEFGMFELYKNNLYEVNEYYKNKKNAIDDKYEEVNNDILMIYRLRNLIVHNAVHPTYSISLYAYKAQLICGTIIRHLVSEYKKTGSAIDQILIRQSSEYDIFCSEFEDHLNKLKRRRAQG